MIKVIKINPKNPAHYMGSKYEKTASLGIAAVAKLVRREIAGLVKKEELPQGQYLVRTDRYSSGQSLDVGIALPDSKRKRKRDSKAARVSERSLESTVLGIVNQYNYYAGGPGSDYQHRRFYTQIITWHK